MMLVPRRNSFDLFDDFFDDEFSRRREKNTLMKTDIKEKNNSYLIDVDLPGFEKENINLSLKNGYLEISAKTVSEDNDSSERFVRKERFYGECSRSFYVGEDITEEDISAEFKNGILKIEIPKKELENKKDEVKQIEIK